MTKYNNQQKVTFVLYAWAKCYTYISRWRLLRWRHVYKATWEAGIAEELEYRRKIGNRVDRCAVAVVIIATAWSVMYRGILSCARREAHDVHAYTRPYSNKNIPY